MKVVTMITWWFSIYKWRKKENQIMKNEREKRCNEIFGPTYFINLWKIRKMYEIN